MSAGTVVTPEQLPDGGYGRGCPPIGSGVAGWWLASDGRWYPPQLHPDSSGTRWVAIDVDPLTRRWAMRWLASDGRWYAPQEHPDLCVAAPVTQELDPSPRAGWWLASDGNWYAPERHPDALATADEIQSAGAPLGSEPY
jgi:hypothetical protein